MVNNRVQFNSIDLGDQAWASFGYSGNTTSKILPRAKGVSIYDTNENGGGLINITINAWVIKTTRKVLEQYFYNLEGNLGREKANLVIDGWTLSNCVIESYNMNNSESQNYSKFTVSLIKSV